MEHLKVMDRRGIFAVSILVATGLSAHGWADLGEERTRRDAMAQRDTPGGQKCTFPSEHPTYLPWLEEDSEVPPPLKDRSGGDARLFWTAPKTAQWQHLGFWTESDLPGGQGEPTGIEHGGVEGQYHLGSVNFTVQWMNAAEGPCNLTVLTLTIKNNDGSISAGQGKMELLRIARSLNGQRPSS
jgi:hypothetical protein